MGKGKGHQSRGFARKSLRAAHFVEFHQQAKEAASSSSRRNNNNSNNNNNNNNNKKPIPTERPQIGLRTLKCIIRERQWADGNEEIQRRRRLGFVPRLEPQPQIAWSAPKQNPPGYILRYQGQASNNGKNKTPSKNQESMNHNNENDNDKDKNNIATLQSMCVAVLGKYMNEYLQQLGVETLHGALSLLPWPTLADLSVVVSNATGVSNDLAIVLGKHPHAECLSLHATLPGELSDERTDLLTDVGIQNLIPQIIQNNNLDQRQQQQQVADSWESLLGDDDDDDDDKLYNGKITSTSSSSSHFHDIELQGCSFRLRRLELVNCVTVSADVFLAWLKKCGCITHLSIAGSFSPQDGPNVLLQLPELLSNLQVLDISRCSWVTESLLESFGECYTLEQQQDNNNNNDNIENDNNDDLLQNNNSRPPPKVIIQGCITTSSVPHQDYYFW